MELKNLEQIKPEGLHVFMPSGINATLYKDNDSVIVDYSEQYRDKYTNEQFERLMEEGIIIANDPIDPQKGLMEAFENTKRKPGDVFTAMNDKKPEYLTADFKNELLSMLDEIAKAYPDVKVRQQATTFMDALGLQEYFGTKAMKDFANKYIKLLHAHVNESINEVKEITRDEWNKTPKDYKMIKNGKPYLVYLDDKTHSTVLGPCKIIDESLDYEEPGNTFQVCIYDGDDENAQPECVSIEDTLEDAIERAKYEYSHSDLDENTVVTVIWVENGETLFYIDKDCEEKLNESLNEEDDKFNYMMLDRLKQDCEYFLGNGNGYEPHLWAGNVEDQIAKMKELYNKVPEKPEWLSLEDIDKYEKDMLAKRDSKDESLNEEEGPYFGNEAIANIALEIEDGNKSGFEPIEFGNWMLNTSVDNKWEALTEEAKSFLLEKIAIPVADGHVSYDDLEIYVSENSALTKEDINSFDVFSPEELDNIFIQGEELRFLVSYELQFDQQIGESFKIKAKKKKKKLDEVDNIDYFVKSVEGENGPFASREAAAQYISQQVQAGKNEADFEIITNNGEDEMNDNQKAPELVTESYKVYNTIGAETVGENTFNSWEEVDNFLQQEWGTYKASMVAENPEFGTEEDENNFLGNYEVEIIEVPAEMEVEVNPEVCPDCNQEPCVCEPCEDEICDVCPDCGETECICNKECEEPCVCPECGKEPCECEKEILEQPVDVVEDFGDEHIGEPEEPVEDIDEPKEETEDTEEEQEIVSPEQAAEVIDKVDDAIDSLEDFINMLVDDEELTQEEQDEIEALDLPTVIDQPDETHVDESLKEELDWDVIFDKHDKAMVMPINNITDVIDFLDLHFGRIDTKLYFLKQRNIEAKQNDDSSIIVYIDNTSYKVNFYIDSLLGTASVKNYEKLDVSESVKPEPPEDDKNEDFKDGMLTDVQDLDLPDAIAQSIDVNDDGTVMRLTDIMKEVKSLKAELEKTISDFKTDIKDVLNSVKQDIQRDVNDVDNKVQDTKTAVDDLTVEEEELEELPPEEPVEGEEEAPEETEEETEEEQVEESYKPTGNIIIDTTAKILKEEKTSLEGIYRRLSARGINKTPLVTTLVEGYITENKLSKKLIKEEDDEMVNSLEVGELRSKDPKIKKFCNKGVLEDLVDAKKKADEVIAKGGSAEEVRDAIDMYSDDDEEAKQAKDYAISKMKESLLNTAKKSKLGLRNLLG